MKELPSIDALNNLIFRHCNIRKEDLLGEDRTMLILARVRILSALRSWDKPSEIEASVEMARRKLQGAIKAVESLDNYAKVLTRREATREADEDRRNNFVKLLETANGEADKRELTAAFLESDQPLSQEQWIDLATVRHMKELERSLRRPIEVAIEVSPSGPGRPRDRTAYALSDIACSLFVHFTGSQPTFWNGGKTPFSRFVAELFVVSGLTSSIRKPIEAAIHKYKDKI